MDKVSVIGAGLAGSEAVWQLVKRDIPVDLYEMRPSKQSPAHHTDQFAELVCSNSLRAANIENAVGLLKEEMRRFDSLIMSSADQHRVPAGGALAVDRHGFSKTITTVLTEHPLVTVHHEEVNDIPAEGVTIIATGPLTSDTMAAAIQKLMGMEYFYFHDAAAPIVYKESIDFNKVYRKSRYDKGDADYLNCPMDAAQYEAFWQELATAECVEPKNFEKEKYFEGCMPVEVMAKRGVDTLRFGPLKPVGLETPTSGEMPYAVIQLRQDNAEDTLYNLVGFQTHLKWGEQQRIFRMIPGLEHAEFARLGVMHRNTYINSPTLLRPTLQYRQKDNLFFAGQLIGVEGYLESAAMGMLAGINAARLVLDRECLTFPKETAIGALSQYIATYEGKSFQPMNINFGLMTPIKVHVKGKKMKKNEKNVLIAERAIAAVAAMAEV